MSRSVEHIVNCHEAASALRRAGKPVWSRVIDIKSILHEDQANESASHVADVSRKIASLLRSQVPKKFLDFMVADSYDSDLDGVIDDMQACTIASLGDEVAEPVEVLNGWLEVVYDWADNNRIWLGN